MGTVTSRADETLLQLALGGHQDAWAELVDRYHAQGTQYIRRRFGDPHLAQDVMQNAWSSVVEAVRRQPPDSFAGLFWTLVKRRLVDELRRLGRIREAATLDSPLSGEHAAGASHADMLEGSAPDPALSAMESEEQGLLQQALAALPDHYRAVIVARQWGGRSNRETARLLVDEGLVLDDGNVEKRVENYYYRGLVELKRQLVARGYQRGGGAG